MSTDWTAYALLLVAAYVIPGPDFVLVLSWSTRRRRDGVLAGLGAQCGVTVHVVACVCGVSVVVARWPWIITVIQVLGALYLLWLGVQTARATGSDEQGENAAGGAFRQGLTTNLLNPKAIVFVTSVLPQFADGTWPLPAQLAVLGAVDVAAGLVLWAVLVVVGAGLSPWIARPRVRRWWQRANGAVLVVIGLLLAVSNLG